MRDAEIRDALRDREESLVDLWLIVMKHFDSCPPEVQQSWDEAKRRSNTAMDKIRHIVMP